MKPESDAGLGSMLGSSAEVEPDPTSTDRDEADAIEQSAADDVMAAMKTGDKGAFRDALKAFVHLCYDE
jgi:hypothetical protein